MLVGHSMGGVVVTQAAATRPANVAALVYVAAFAPSDGQSLLDLTAWPEAAGDQVQANLVVAGDPPVATLPAQAAAGALFGSCTEEQAAWAVGRLRGQPLEPFAHRVSIDPPDALGSLARAYVLCRRDRAIALAMQRRMVQTAGIERVIEIDTDHFPMISRPDELLAALDEIAGV